MKWLEIIIKTKKEAEDSIFNLLKEIGAKGASIEERPKNLTLIKGYFTEGINTHETLFHIKEGLKLISNYLDIGMGEVEIRYLNEEDWANSWKKYYKPVEIGKVAIVPSWERYENREGKIIINIDPGMAFGTGTHETTILCILAIEEFLRPGMDVIDVGTGSGILAIIAKKLGAHRVLAIDIDETAVKIAKENAILNKVNIEVIKNNLIEGIDEKFHLILANINAEEIIKLSKDIKRIMKKGSYFIASGITKNTLKDVERALEENNLKVIDVMEKNSWFLILSRERD